MEEPVMPGFGRTAPAVLAIAATYIYFLLYAQFAFLALLQTRLDAGEIERMMISMGLTGLFTSLATAVALRRFPPRGLLSFGFAGAGTTALAALAVHGATAFLIVAALIGFFTAVLTVTLAARLRDLAPGRGFASTAGLGTGLAYLFCNVPAVFAGSPTVQSWTAAVVCAIGLLAVSRTPERVEHGASTAHRALSAADFRGWGFLSVVLAFLALIWLDSAAFVIIQESAALKGATWGSSAQKLIQGGVHAVAAIAAGVLIDRGFFRSLLLGTYGLFAVAFTLLESSPGDTLVAGPLYAIGIATYSVALVVYPSYHGDGPGLVSRRFRAGWLYGVAGWLGSALGVGMAQSQHHIPRFFLVAAGVVLLLSAGFGQLTRLRSLVRVHGVTLIGLVAGLAFFSFADPHPLTPSPWLERGDRKTPTDDLVARGRQVYISEGCIHCHSQYVRPHNPDIALWGPPRDGHGEAPPLYGNRRQGPDLSHAGNRRSAAWHRLHLIAPRSLMPSSRMPSYAHLFAPGTAAGEELVAYLASLGTDQQRAWYEGVRQAPVAAAAHGGDPENGGRLFQRFCAACHGVGGRGDGPLSPAIYRPAMNLRKGTLWLVSWEKGATDARAEGLARLLRYGMPGTSMPGHETFSDRQIADLVAFVEQLLARPLPSSTVEDAAS